MSFEQWQVGKKIYIIVIVYLFLVNKMFWKNNTILTNVNIGHVCTTLKQIDWFDSRDIWLKMSVLSVEGVIPCSVSKPITNLICVFFCKYTQQKLPDLVTNCNKNILLLGKILTKMSFLVFFRMKSLEFSCIMRISHMCMTIQIWRSMFLNCSEHNTDFVHF